MAFSNPIVGTEVLIRDSIQSRNFSHLVAGWRIAADGSAEFTGLVIISGDGSGNSVTISNGSLIFTNALLEITTEIRATGEIFSHNLTATNGADTEIFEGAILFPPATPYAWHIEDPNITASYYPVGAPSFATAPSLRLASGSDDPGFPGAAGAVIQLNGTSEDLTAPVQVQSFNNGTGVFLEWLHDGDFTASKSVSAYGRDVGAGTVGWDCIRANTAAVTAETIALTTNSFTFLAGRAYEIEIKGLASSTIANDRVQLRVRKTNAAGAIYYDTMSGLTVPAINVNASYDYRSVVINVTGSDITNVLVMTYARNAGTGNVKITADATNPAYIKVNDIGLAATYPNARELS